MHTSGLSINLLTAIARRHAQILITPSVGKAHAGDASAADVCMLMVLPLLSCRCPVHLPLYWLFMLAMLVSLQFGRSMGGGGELRSCSLWCWVWVDAKFPSFPSWLSQGSELHRGLGALAPPWGMLGRGAAKSPASRAPKAGTSSDASTSSAKAGEGLSEQFGADLYDPVGSLSDPSTLEENYQMVWKGEGQGSYAATSYKEFQKGRLERNRPLSLPKWGSRTSCPV